VKAAALYFLTAIVTGLYAFCVGIVKLWGATPNLLPHLSFLGSVLLLVAAVASAFSARPAAKIALAGSAAISCLYVPLMVATAFQPSAFWPEPKSLAPFKEFVAIAGILGGPILLAATIVCAVSILWRSSEVR